MKIYCFYRNNGKLDKSIRKENKISREEFPLYAITSDKKIFKKFKKERNMDLFKITIHDMDKDEFEYFINTHRSMILGDYIYLYFPYITDTYRKTESMEVSVVSTEQEHQQIEYVIDSISIDAISYGSLRLSNPMVFKKEYRHALAMLEYDSIFKLSMVNNYGLPFDFQNYDDDEYLSPPCIQLDEFRVFIELFGYMFR